MLVDVKKLEISESELLRCWAEKLQKAKHWDGDVLEELHRAVFRVCISIGDVPDPVGFASVTEDYNPDATDTERFAFWFDHLYIDPIARGKGLMRWLYQSQVDFLRGKEEQWRIFRMPMNETVVQFSISQGWRFLRVDRDAPFGIYELPREAIAR